MSPMPDYTVLRAATPFRWYVGAGPYVLMTLTETSFGEYNLNPEACIDMFRRGLPLYRERFPERDIFPDPGLSTPAVSYGHVNGLGSELLFPPDGEVAHTHIYDTLEAGIAALRRPVDFATAGMAPFYLEYKRRLEAAFPGRTAPFSYGLEGPLTTAYELRGEGFFLDLMDRPVLAAEFLRLVTASIAAFAQFHAAANGTTAFKPSAGLCDDLASVVPARLYPELVLPFWDLYFRALTDGTRHAHVEDLRVEQLPFLETIGLSGYDPSISHKLNPRLIRDHCRVPFGWRLGSFHYLTMSSDDVRDWVFQAVADGASSVFTHLEGLMVRDETRPKVYAFVEAARHAQTQMEAGATRENIGRLVSPAGRQRFWEHWPP